MKRKKITKNVPSRQIAYKSWSAGSGSSFTRANQSFKSSCWNDEWGWRGRGGRCGRGSESGEINGTEAMGGWCGLPNKSGDMWTRITHRNQKSKKKKKKKKKKSSKIIQTNTKRREIERERKPTHKIKAHTDLQIEKFKCRQVLPRKRKRRSVFRRCVQGSHLVFSFSFALFLFLLSEKRNNRNLIKEKTKEWNWPNRWSQSFFQIFCGGRPPGFDVGFIAQFDRSTTSQSKQQCVYSKLLSASSLWCTRLCRGSTLTLWSVSFISFKFFETLIHLKS